MFLIEWEKAFIWTCPCLINWLSITGDLVATLVYFGLGQSNLTKACDEVAEQNNLRNNVKGVVVKNEEIVAEREMSEII